MRRLLALLMLASLCFAWQKKGKQPKLPEVAVMEITCHRSTGDVHVDGRLKIQSTKPIRKLQLLVDFLGSDKQLLQTKRGPVDSDFLEPGDETEFHLRVSDPVRAVLYTIRAEDGDGRDLRVEKPGPFPIE
ncbi:MAG: hypothetical protein JNL98_41680 [Bryobacterales bacterium]|nr:hypothetical protein [Bryobacterales bacterium]